MLNLMHLLYSKRSLDCRLESPIQHKTVTILTCADQLSTLELNFGVIKPASY